MFLIQGDEKVIRGIFQNRKQQLLSMQRYTAAVSNLGYHMLSILHTQNAVFVCQYTIMSYCDI